MSSSDAEKQLWLICELKEHLWCAFELVEVFVDAYGKRSFVSQRSPVFLAQAGVGTGRDGASTAHTISSTVSKYKEQSVLKSSTALSKHAGLPNWIGCRLIKGRA